MSQLAMHPNSETTSQLAKLFPLPLSPIEAFMLADGRSWYPMMCDIEVHVQGTIERGPFEEALAFAIQRAPLFRSIVEKDKKHGLVWQLTDRMPQVEWEDFGVPCQNGYDDLVDLFEELGLRVYVRSGAERSSFLLHFHHATSDGVGSIAFVEDLLTAYHNATPGTIYVKPRKWEPERLLNRCNSSLENPGWRRGLYDVYCGIYGASNFFMQRPLPMTAKRAPLADNAPRQQIGHITQAVSSEATLAMRKWTSAEKVTVNDVLLRDLFVTLHGWMSDQGIDIGSRHLRILMPQSLRGRGDAAMPTTNDIGFAFMARRGNMIQKPDELLRSLAPETAAIRKDNLSRHFIGGLAAVQSLGLLPWMLNGSSCFSTAVLTNFGNSWRRFQAKLPPADGGLTAGNLVYDGLTGTPPCRPNTAAAFCVCTSADQIFVSLKHDPFHFSLEESHELLSRYIDQITRSGDGPSS